MSVITKSDKRIFRELLSKIEETTITTTESFELDLLIKKYWPDLMKAAEMRLGVQIKNIFYFFTREERNAVKQLKTTKTNRNTVTVAAKDAGTWYQLQSLLLKRMLVASDETLDEEGSSSSIDPTIQDNGSRLRKKVGERGM